MINDDVDVSFIHTMQENWYFLLLIIIIHVILGIKGLIVYKYCNIRVDTIFVLEFGMWNHLYLGTRQKIENEKSVKVSSFITRRFHRQI